MRILLIDDELGVTENLELYLERNHTVQAMHDFETRAEVESRLNRFNPDGVILDFEMPGLAYNGDTLFAWIRDWNEDVRIVFYTRYAQVAALRREMLNAGAQESEVIFKNEVANDIALLLRALGED